MVNVYYQPIFGFIINRLMNNKIGTRIKTTRDINTRFDLLIEGKDKLTIPVITNENIITTKNIKGSTGTAHIV